MGHPDGRIGPLIDHGDQIAFEGPSFRHWDPPDTPDTPYIERPRIVRINWPTADEEPLTISFSVPIAYAGNQAARIKLALKGSNEARIGRCVVTESDPWSLACEFPGDAIDETAVERVLLPRGIVRRGGTQGPATLWAAPDRRLGFLE